MREQINLRNQDVNSISKADFFCCTAILVSKEGYCYKTEILRMGYDFQALIIFLTSVFAWP
jgi:hypothetical protein